MICARTVVGTGGGDVEVVAGFPSPGSVALYAPSEPDGPSLALTPAEARALATALNAAADHEDPPPAAVQRPLPAGWAFPTPTARKAHYFRAEETRSLCGRYAYYGEGRESGRDRSPDNCMACRRAGGWAE